VAAGVEADVKVVQVAVPGTRPGRDGGGPPKSPAGHVVEISVVAPMAARQGSKARRVDGVVWRKPAPGGG
jgi:hypothetical protein